MDAGACQAETARTLAGGTLAAACFGAPWWVILTTILAGLAVVTIQSTLCTVMPQDSPDRLTWWTNRRHHHTRRRQQAAPTRSRHPR